MSIKEIEQPAATDIHQENNSTFQTGRVLAVSSGHLTHDLFPAFLSPLLPLLIEKLSMTRAAAGALMLFIQGPSLIQPLVGRLADRVNLKFVVILAPAITATAMSLVGIAPSYTWLALFLTIVGISSAIFHAVGPALAGSFAGNRLGKGMSIWMVGGDIGRMLGPMLIVAVVSAFTLEGSVWAMLAGWLASFVLYILLRDIPVALPAAANGVQDWRVALREMRSIMIPLILLVVVRALYMNAMQIFLPTYMSESGAGLWMAGAAATVFSGATVLGTLLGGWLSDYFGRRRLLLISLITTPFLLLTFLRSTGVLAMGLLFGVGLMAGPTTPIVLALVQESFPEKRSFASGIYIAASFVIRSLASVLLGALGDCFGLGSAFAISAVVLFLGIPLVRMLPRKLKGNENGIVS